MSDPISAIRITNFKSIRSCEITGCKRINIFTGAPNAGKSNILEALSLLSLPYLRENPSKKMSQFVRFEQAAELFYNGGAESIAEVTTNIGECTLSYDANMGLSVFLDFDGKAYRLQLDDKQVVKGLVNHPFFEPPVKKYTYTDGMAAKKAHAQYLIPPLGHNLMPVIYRYDYLRKEIVSLFKDYGLEPEFDEENETIKVIRHKANGDVFLIPYSTLADRLKRVTFFKSASASNDNSILLFDDPEASPVVTREFIEKIDNQLFISSNSPFILSDLIRNVYDDIAVYNVYYEDDQSKVRQLSEEQLKMIAEKG